MKKQLRVKLLAIGLFLFYIFSVIINCTYIPPTRNYTKAEVEQINREERERRKYSDNMEKKIDIQQQYKPTKIINQDELVDELKQNVSLNHSINTEYEDGKNNENFQQEEPSNKQVQQEELEQTEYLAEEVYFYLEFSETLHKNQSQFSDGHYSDITQSSVQDGSDTDGLNKDQENLKSQSIKKIEKNNFNTFIQTTLWKWELLQCHKNSQERIIIKPTLTNQDQWYQIYWFFKTIDNPKNYIQFLEFKYEFISYKNKIRDENGYQNISSEVIRQNQFNELKQMVQDEQNNDQINLEEKCQNQTYIINEQNDLQIVEIIELFSKFKDEKEQKQIQINELESNQTYIKTEEPNKHDETQIDKQEHNQTQIKTEQPNKPDETQIDEQEQNQTQINKEEPNEPNENQIDEQEPNQTQIKTEEPNKPDETQIDEQEPSEPNGTQNNEQGPNQIQKKEEPKELNEPKIDEQEQNQTQINKEEPNESNEIQIDREEPNQTQIDKKEQKQTKEIYEQSDIETNKLSQEQERPNQSQPTHLTQIQANEEQTQIQTKIELSNEQSIPSQTLINHTNQTQISNEIKINDPEFKALMSNQRNDEIQYPKQFGSEEEQVEQYLNFSFFDILHFLLLFIIVILWVRKNYCEKQIEQTEQLLLAGLNNQFQGLLKQENQWMTDVLYSQKQLVEVFDQYNKQFN